MQLGLSTPYSVHGRFIRPPPEATGLLNMTYLFISRTSHSRLAGPLFVRRYQAVGNFRGWGRTVPTQAPSPQKDGLQWRSPVEAVCPGIFRRVWWLWRLGRIPALVRVMVARKTSKVVANSSKSDYTVHFLHYKIRILQLHLAQQCDGPTEGVWMSDTTYPKGTLRVALEFPWRGPRSLSHASMARGRPET
jgi:hypothetical protein